MSAVMNIDYYSSLLLHETVKIFTYFMQAYCFKLDNFRTSPLNGPGEVGCTVYSFILYLLELQNGTPNALLQF